MLKFGSKLLLKPPVLTLSIQQIEYLNKQLCKYVVSFTSSAFGDTPLINKTRLHTTHWILNGMQMFRVKSPSYIDVVTKPKVVTDLQIIMFCDWEVNLIIDQWSIWMD